MCILLLVNLAFLLVAISKADDSSCPFNAKGNHPKCICADDKPYDQVNRICSTVLDAQFLLAKCPKGSEGQFPACICAADKVYVPERDECVSVDKQQCPVGSRKVNNNCVCEDKNGFKYEFDEIFWICRPWYIPTTTPPPKPCPTHQHRVGDKCEWDLCPAGYTSKTNFWPDCIPPPTCQQKGMIGEYPNCYARVIEQTCSGHQTGRYPDCHWLPCPDAYVSKTGYWPDCAAPPSCSDRGLIGDYPDCRPPAPTCPPYHHRDKNGECVRIPCPPGHDGDYQPNCKLVLKCPSEYPGIWPNCNIYATTPRNYKTTVITTTPKIPTTSTSTSRTSTTRSTTTTTPRPTTPTTARTTTQRIEKCYCDCYSNEIVIFKDNVVRDPARKYKRFVNEKHANKNNF